MQSKIDPLPDGGAGSHVTDPTGGTSARAGPSAILSLMALIVHLRLLRCAKNQVHDKWWKENHIYMA